MVVLNVASQTPQKFDIPDPPTVSPDAAGDYFFNPNSRSAASGSSGRKDYPNYPNPNAYNGNGYNKYAGGNQPLNDSTTYGRVHDYTRNGGAASKALLLFKAVQHNQHVLVAQNLEEGADFQAYYPMEQIDGRTALRVACKQGNIRLTRLLACERKANLFLYLQKDRWTCLHSAAYHGHEHILKLLLQEDCWCNLNTGNTQQDWDHVGNAGEPNAAALSNNMDGFSLLHVLCEIINSNLPNGGSDLLKWALANNIGGMVNTNDLIDRDFFSPSKAKARHLNFMTPDVKTQRDVRDTDATATAGINIASKRAGFENWTPLHLCAARGKIKSIIQLLRFGADLHCRTGDFVLHLPGFQSLCQGDIVAHADYPALNSAAPEDQRSPTRNPAIFGTKEFEDFSIDNGLLPIHLAAFGGHLRTLQFLLQHGQNINATTKRYRWTPLFFAVWNNHHAIVKEICRNGGRRFLNCTDRRADSQWTVLALAVAGRGDIDMIQMLIAYGADPLVRLRMHDFPGNKFTYHKTAHSTNEGLENWSSNDYRVGLLHLAVVRGDVDILKCLVPLVRTAHFTPIKLASVPILTQKALGGSSASAAAGSQQQQNGANSAAAVVPGTSSQRNMNSLNVLTQPSNSSPSLPQSRSTSLGASNRTRKSTNQNFLTPRPSPSKQLFGTIQSNNTATTTCPSSRQTTKNHLSASQLHHTAVNPLVSALERTSTNIGREALVRAKKKSNSLPVEEKLDSDNGNCADPLFFQTSEGWSPLTLAIQLQVVDPNAHLGYEFITCGGRVENQPAYPEDGPKRVANSSQPRADVFLQLLQTRRALREETPWPVPVVPSRFNEMSEILAIRVIQEFLRLSQAVNIEKVAFSAKSPDRLEDHTVQVYPSHLISRCLRGTFIAAAHANRMRLAKVLLDAPDKVADTSGATKLVDVNLEGVFPIELRPLHLVCASGFGHFAQLLLDYKADPTVEDEQGRKPIEKLHGFYNSAIAASQRG
ncbi:unnamed protein product [Amoebophrya sp. A120]|nr:unnamed protein product [Amoebophrya sp. A120]|eukprot:GSA120T00009893001.1